MMQPSAVAQQLFEWAHESLHHDTQARFDARLRRFGEAFTQLISEYEASDEVNKEQSLVLGQFLDGYEELYLAALSTEKSEQYRHRIVQSLLYGASVSSRLSAAPTIKSILDEFASIIKLEMEHSNSETIADSLVDELESPLVNSSRTFIESEKKDEIAASAEILQIYHGILHDLMLLAVQKDSGDTLSASLKLYESKLSTSTLRRRIRSQHPHPRDEEVFHIEVIEQFEKFEELRPLDLLGEALQQHSEDGDLAADCITVLTSHSEGIDGVDNLLRVFFEQSGSGLDITDTGGVLEEGLTEPFGRGPTSTQWQARALATELVRQSSPKMFQSYPTVEFDIPSSSSDQDAIESARRAFQWLTAEQLPESIRDDIGQREIQARIFMMTELLRRALQSAEDDSHQSIIEAPLDGDLINTYAYSRNENLSGGELPSLLRKRGIILEKPFRVGRDGVIVAQYLEPKVRFLEDEVDPFYHAPDPESVIMQGYNDCLVEDIFQSVKCSSKSQLEEKVRSSLQANLTRNPTLVERLGARIFEDEQTLEPASDGNSLVPYFESFRIHEARLSNYEALVIYGSSPRVVEFHGDTGLFNFDVKTHRAASGNLSHYSGHGNIQPEKCLVSVKVPYGIRPGRTVGKAFMLSD